MDRNFEISFRHFEPTERIRARIDELIAELDAFGDDIVSGRVVIDGKNRHGSKTVVEVAVELSYRGGTAIGRREGEFPNPAGQRTFDSAMTEAFRTAASQARSDLGKRRQPDEAARLDHQPQQGRIESLNHAERNGFIEIPGSAPLFFAEAVVQGEFDALSEGDEVMAVAAEADGALGPQASRVKPIGPLG